MKNPLKTWGVSIGVIIGVILLIRLLNKPNYGIDNKIKNSLLQVLLSDNIPKISVEAASRKKDSVVFLDTRSREEFDISHIHDAVFVGYDDFDLSRIQAITKEQEVIVYCSVGKRSDEISKKLINAGYTNLHNLYGGIFEWFNRGHEIVDQNGRATDTIHGYNRLFGWWLQRGKTVY